MYLYVSLNSLLHPWSKSRLKSWLSFILPFLVFFSLGNLLHCGNNPHTIMKTSGHTGGRETRPQVNIKTAGQAAIWRPWKVGLHKASQKPWDTLCRYIKDTVRSSSLLLFLLPSSSALSPDYSLFICLSRLFSSSTRLLSVSSFTVLFGLFMWPNLVFYIKPTVLMLKAENAIRCWWTGDDCRLKLSFILLESCCFSSHNANRVYKSLDTEK